MVFQQTFLSERPKSLDSVDIHFTIREPFPMIDSSMFEPIERQGMIQNVTPEDVEKT
jgi:hypothetical protein